MLQQHKIVKNNNIYIFGTFCLFEGRQAAYPFSLFYFNVGKKCAFTT